MTRTPSAFGGLTLPGASELEKAIWWPATYLRDEPGAKRVLNLWLRCKISRMRFDGEVRRKGWSRATCYRRRDRALAAISIGLDRDGVPVMTS